MSETVKKITGRTFLALASLFVVLVANGVAVSHVEAATQANAVGVQVSAENGLTYLVANSPSVSTAPGAMMTLTYKKDTGALLCISGVSTFATFPITPYDWNIQIGVLIPVSACSVETGGLVDGDYRTFVCNTDAGLNCNGQDWGNAAYPTYQEANSNSKPYYYDFTKQNGTYSPNDVLIYDDTYQTRFISQSLTGTNQLINLVTTYNLNLDEFDETNTPNAIRTDIVNSAGVSVVAYINTTTFVFGNGEKTATSAISRVSFNPTNTNLPAGTYTALTRFYSTSANQPVFTRSLIQQSFTIVGNNITTSTTTINQNGTTPIITSIERPCGITSLSGCIINAFSFLFVPQSSTITKITKIPETLSTKFPFAYVYDFQQSITGIYVNNTSQPSLSFNFAGLGELTLISQSMVANVPFAGLILQLLTAVAWLLFGMQMYRRTLRVFNTNPT